jgi:hypothetical protein
MKAAFLIVFLFISANAFCETVDSAKTANQPLPIYATIPLQLVGGAIGYTIGYSIASPVATINDVDPANNYGVAFNIILRAVTCGIAITFIGNKAESDSVSYWWGMGGAFLGPLYLSGLINHLGIYNSNSYKNSYFVRYFYWCGIDLIGSILTYQIVRLINYLTANDANKNNVGNSKLLNGINISPSIIEHGAGLSLQASW